MRLIRQSEHVKSCDIELRFDIDATRGSARLEFALSIEVDVAWYHMIALRINLMNNLGCNDFLAREVLVCSESGCSCVLNHVIVAEVAVGMQSAPVSLLQHCHCLFGLPHTCAVQVCRGTYVSWPQSPDVRPIQYIWVLHKKRTNRSLRSAVENRSLFLLLIESDNLFCLCDLSVQDRESHAEIEQLLTQV